MWSGSAIRAILTNPRYLGHQVAGRQRRKDELLDPTDPAAGTTSRQRWQPTDAWVTSDEPAWPAIVDAELWERVNARITNTLGPQRRRPRATPGSYLLAGLVRCKVCGQSMHGATLKGNPYYRCNRVRPDYAGTGHPRTTAIREDRIVSVLDDWLDQLVDAENRETTIAAVLAADATQAPEPSEVQAARRALRDLPVELDRVLAAIRAGMDPELAVITTKEIQRDLAAAEATITAWEHQHDTLEPLTADEIREALDHAGDLAAMMAEAERETRARLYQALDLELLLDPVGDSPTLDVRLQLCGGGGRNLRPSGYEPIPGRSRLSCSAAASAGQRALRVPRDSPLLTVVCRSAGTWLVHRLARAFATQSGHSPLRSTLAFFGEVLTFRHDPK